MQGSLKIRYQHGIETASRQVDGSTLGFFRILWGLAMLLETRSLAKFATEFFDPSLFHFHFTGFSWIRHFPSPALTEFEISVMMLALFFVTVGFAFRPAAILFFLGYAHLFFSEAAAYSNLHYLILLISGLLIFTRADSSLSLYQWLRGKGKLPEHSVPHWNYLLIRFQVLVVYFFSAIAKLNRDWLIDMEPVRFWLKSGKLLPDWLAPLASQEWFIALGNWGGFLIDLLCPILLLFRKTRIAGIVILLAVQLLNSLMFRGGHFPLIEIVLMVIFLPPGCLRKFLKSNLTIRESNKPAKAILVLAGLYIAFQLLFPLRAYLIPGNNPSWSERGQYFSWRLMQREKTSIVGIHLGNPDVREWLKTRPNPFPKLGRNASQKVGENPYFLREWILAFHESLDNFGKGDTPIYIFATSTLNGRPYYPLIDPNIDLAKTKASLFWKDDWILPLPNLPVDFEQIQPFDRQFHFSNEAIRQYLSEHPGPGNQFLDKLPNETPATQPE